MTLVAVAQAFYLSGPEKTRKNDYGYLFYTEKYAWYLKVQESLFEPKVSKKLHCDCGTAVAGQLVRSSTTHGVIDSKMGPSLG